MSAMLFGVAGALFIASVVVGGETVGIAGDCALAAGVVLGLVARSG